MLRLPPQVFAVLIIVSLCTALAACGGGPTPAKLVDTPQEAVSRVGDVTVRANLLPTASLSAAIATQYGIEREDDRVMLLVSVRKGPDDQDIALPATIEAQATNLQGQRRGIAMRELRNGEYVDYVGTFGISPPDTLSFDLQIAPEGETRSSMQFTRDFAAQ